jgi:hypothetical protein
MSDRPGSPEPAPFVPPDFQPPLGLDEPAFRLRPLGPEHNASDYAAWTSSMAHIAATPGFDRGWPHLMTLDENRADLERHADDFAARRGFTYTVLAADRDEVIGCVYIYPDPTLGGAHLACWVRAVDADLDGTLHETVRAWLAADWPFERLTDPRAG